MSEGEELARRVRRHLEEHAGGLPSSAAAPAPPPREINRPLADICLREAARLGYEIDWCIERKHFAEAEKLIADTKILLAQARKDYGH